jgi:hypothetical protein
MVSEEFRNRATNHIISNAAIGWNPLRDVAWRVERKEQRHNFPWLQIPKVRYDTTPAQESRKSAPHGVEDPVELSDDLDSAATLEAALHKGMEKSQRQARQLHIEAASYGGLRRQMRLNRGEDAPCILDQVRHLSMSEAAVFRTSCPVFSHECAAGDAVCPRFEDSPKE